MDLAVIERSLRESDGAVIVADPKLVRRVIKAHRRLPGLGLGMPHARCYALPRAELLAIIDAVELGVPRGSLPDDVILVARPEPRELTGRTSAEILERLWRLVFHAHVHIAIDRRVASRKLDAAGIRERIDRIGQAEFDEVRSILRHDERLLPPADDRETFTELAALYLELRYFAPGLLRTTFPGLVETGRVDEVLDAEIDARQILDRSCPAGAEQAKTVIRAAADEASWTMISGPPSLGPPEIPAPARPRTGDPRKLDRTAEIASRRGNAVRAALLHATAAANSSPPESGARRAAMRADLEALEARLEAALRPLGKDERASGDLVWTPSLVILTEQAAATRGLRYPVEARLLFDLQRAAVAHEKTTRAVDLVTWALSLGRTPIVRTLPATRELRVARALHDAAAKVRFVRVPSAERKIFSKLLRSATHRAEENVRTALRPKLLRAFSVVGLRPENVPERVARDKVVEELLDESVSRGYLKLSHLRDALSRNRLKLEDLSGLRELVTADALLEIDRLLARGLDGVHQRGEIYLRGLQKASSLAFGTRPGRLFTLYLALPLGGAFVVLEGVSHILSWPLRWLGVKEMHLLDLPTFVGTALLFLGLIHSDFLRRAAKRALSLAGVVLATLLLRAPRWLFTRPTVKRVLQRPLVRAFLRRGVVPLVTTIAVYFFSPLSNQETPLALGGALVLFAVLSALFNTSVALFFENAFFDWIEPSWRNLSEHVLPGLFRLVTGTFRMLIDLLERAIYRVDEWLRFREGEWRGAVVPKAALGIVWFVVAYTVRLYVTLLVEPEINPVKHFPVCTVAHKLMIPFAGEILRALQNIFSPLGAILGGTIAGTTAFLVPSVSGFLVWELRENWKLYRANRAEHLTPAIVGSHGETMTALMVPGFHSGTLPKLFEKRRRTAQREDDQARQETPGRRLGARAEGSLGRFREGLEELEIALVRFVDRELVGLLRRSRRWPHGPIAAKGAELAPNRVKLRLACAALGPAECVLLLEEQSGLLVASVAEAGFLDRIDPESDAARLFENALAGFYHLAAVDLVRESIAAAIGADTPYDVADEGLVVWPSEGYRTEVVYSLELPRGSPLVEPILRGEAPSKPPPLLDARQILFRHQAIAWSAWTSAWGAADRGSGAIPRLVRGASLLPRRTA